MYTRKFEPGVRYLVFLTPAGERTPGVSAVTGYLAGLFREDDPGSAAFGRVDDESDQLPAALTAADVRAAADADR